MILPIYLKIFAIQCKAFNQSTAVKGQTRMRVDEKFKFSLSFGLKLSCALIDFERAQTLHESFLPFVVTLDGLPTTLVLIWPELMIVDES